MNQPPEPRPLPEGEDPFEEVHVTLADGRSIYWPKGDMTRLAPAAVCNVASRMIQLRKAIKADPFDMREVERLIAAPISFEKEFLSGDSLTVHNAIKALGIEALPTPSVESFKEEFDRKLAAMSDDEVKESFREMGVEVEIAAPAVNSEERESPLSISDLLKLAACLKGKQTLDLSPKQVRRLVAEHEDTVRDLAEKTAEVEKWKAAQQCTQGFVDRANELLSSGQLGAFQLTQELTALREEVSRLREARTDYRQAAVNAGKDLWAFCPDKECAWYHRLVLDELDDKHSAPAEAAGEEGAS